MGADMSNFPPLPLAGPYAWFTNAARIFFVVFYSVQGTTGPMLVMFRFPNRETSQRVGENMFVGYQQ